MVRLWGPWQVALRLRPSARIFPPPGIVVKSKKKDGVKMKKMQNKVAVFATVFMGVAAMAHADGSAYFTLPASFADDVTATIVGIAGGILVILGLMFAWRKTIKSVNRS